MTVTIGAIGESFLFTVYLTLALFAGRFVVAMVTDSVDDMNWKRDVILCGVVALFVGVMIVFSDVVLFTIPLG